MNKADKQKLILMTDAEKKTFKAILKKKVRSNLLPNQLPGQLFLPEI